MKILIVPKLKFESKKNKIDFIEFADYFVFAEGLFFENQAKTLFISLSKKNQKKSSESNDNLDSFISINVKNEITIKINDLNIHPIYYTKIDGSFIITNNLYLLKYLDIFLEIDDVGLVQRLSGADYTNFGDRTLLKNVYRTIPNKIFYFKNGEKIVENLKTFEYRLEKPGINIIESLRTDLFAAHKSVFENFDNIDVALSGGLDSRLSIGILADIFKSNPSEFKKVRALTYGSYWNYETRIAERLANNIGIQHVNIWDDLACWPTIKELDSYMENGGYLGLSVWNNLNRFFDYNGPLVNHCLIMGDLLEALAGRKLSFGLSRNDKIKQYVKREKHACTDKNSFDLIRQKIKTNILNSIENTYNLLLKYSPAYSDKLKLKDLIEQSTQDVERIFDECKRYDPKTSSQFSEIFQWILYSQPEYRNQTGHFNSITTALSPASEQAILAKTTQIDPFYRSNGELIINILKSLDCHKALNLPVASSPYIKIYSPAILRNFSNYLRVVADNNFKRKRMEDKNITSRTNWLNSVNWVKIYNLFPYEHYNHLLANSLTLHPQKVILKRANLNSQPLVNYDVMNWIFVIYFSEQLVKR